MNTELSQSLQQAVHEIKQTILAGQYHAAKHVNRVQLVTYYSIGKYISQHSRQGKWGTNAIQTISEQLLRELPGLRGFSANSLKNMRKFYEHWQMLDNNSTIMNVELAKSNSTIAIVDFPIEDFFSVPFTHHIRILEKTKDLSECYYYLHRVAQEHLSIDKLQQVLNQQAFQHQGEIPNNFSSTLTTASEARKAVMMFKDEYLLNFINVEEIGEREQIDVDERVIEQKIIDNIKNFILAFGSDFAFIGNQYHLEAYGVEQFPDLLFFNRELNALVVVELKYGEFKTSYLGQLMGYLRIIDDHVRKPHENPTIGIVLCKSANKEFVEYVIQDYNKPMGVATYKTLDDMPESIRKALPNNEQLQQLLSPDSKAKYPTN